MKAVILAGGLGTRLSEETNIKPKPMVEIGNKPILWHILKLYSFYSINDFVICCGYKGHVIKDYFANYFLHNSDVTFNMLENKMEIHSTKTEPWNITLVDTGEDTNTGGRIKRIKKHIKNEIFCMTYGDGLSNVNIKKLINHHKKEKKLATLTAGTPPGRYGAISVNDNLVKSFREKADGNSACINGGFFVLNPEIFDYISSDKTSFEFDTLPEIAKKKQLSSYFHSGFWQSMDTLRDKKELQELWDSNNPPWIIK